MGVVFCPVKMLLLLSVLSLPPSLCLPSPCECDLIRVSASGGAAEHQYQFLGDYKPEGSLWDSVTYYKSPSDRFLSPSVFSDPSIGQITWVLTEMLLGLNGGIMNQKYTNYTC